MIGSISKIRPCGHAHVYKYAHAKKYADMQRVSVNFKEDSDGHGNWGFFMTNVQDLGSIFSGTLPNLTNLDVFLPNCTTASWGASHVTGTIDWKLDMPKATYTHAMMYGYTSIRNNVTLILPEAINISAMNGGNGIRGTYNLYAPKATNCNTIFSWGGYGASGIDKMNMYIPSATDIGDITMYDIPYLKYDVDEDGNLTFLSNKPKAESVFMTFKNLEKGSMQLSQLNKEYSTAFLNDLPDWTGNTTTHSLTLGIHLDNKYDPELQTELAKVGYNYTPTINLSGGPTTNKNWDLKVNWNGNSKGHAYEPPMPDIEFSSNDIPENYTRLAYLCNDGSAYVKTGYTPTNTTGFYVEGESIGKSNGYPIGTCNHWNGGGIIGYNLSNWSAIGGGLWGAPRVFFGQTDKSMKHEEFYGLIHNTPSTMRLNYKNDRFGFLIIGEAKFLVDTIPDITYEPSYEFYLYANNSKNTVQEAWKGKLRRVQITEGEELIRDFVPCLDADGVPCMRDLVNGVDYYNAGSGQFTYELA